MHSQNMVTSESEAELSSIYHNIKHAYHFQNILRLLGHTPTRIQIVTEKKTSHVLLNNDIKPK